MFRGVCSPRRTWLNATLSSEAWMSRACLRGSRKHITKYMSSNYLQLLWLLFLLLPLWHPCYGFTSGSLTARSKAKDEEATLSVPPLIPVTLFQALLCNSRWTIQELVQLIHQSAQERMACDTSGLTTRRALLVVSQHSCSKDMHSRLLGHYLFTLSFQAYITMPSLKALSAFQKRELHKYKLLFFHQNYVHIYMYHTC